MVDFRHRGTHRNEEVRHATNNTGCQKYTRDIKDKSLEDKIKKGAAHCFSSTPGAMMISVSVRLGWPAPRNDDDFSVSGMF